MPPVETEQAAPFETPRRRAPLFIGIAIVLVVALGAGILAYQYVADNGADEAYRLGINNAASLVSQGDYQAAIEAAESIIPNLRDGTNEYFNARSVRDTALFGTGERENRIQAIKNTKEEYILSANAPFEQARAVNVVLGYLNAGFEQYVFDEVFSGEPFQRFLVEGDRGSSIRKLAEHSYQLAPSTESLFRVGQWYSDRMRNLYGDWEATEEEKMQYAEEILKILDQADGLLAVELQQTEGRLFQYTIEPRYYFWEAYLYGVVARMKPEYLVQAKASLAQLEQIYNTRLDGNGNKIPFLATRLPYAYANYAWALYEVKGEAGYPEARENLDKLIAIVDADPDVHEGHYLSLIEKNAKNADRWESVYSARMMVQLAKIHPPFIAFLAKYGKQ